MTEIYQELISNVPAAYRTVSLDAIGRVLVSEPLTARDDDQAVKLAMNLIGVAAVELWDGIRYMAHFPALPNHRARSDCDLTIFCNENDG